MTKKEPSYYSVTPATVRYDESLSASAKLLYGEIAALSNKHGYCFATNDYFAELYNVGTRSVTRWIAELKDAGHITVDTPDKGGNRRIFLSIPAPKMSDPLDENVHEGIDENVQHNITSINTTSNISLRTQKFVVPDQRELLAYVLERGGTELDAEAFFDHHQARGWRLRQGPMKDWKAAVRTWLRSEFRKTPNTPQRKKTCSTANCGYTPVMTYGGRGYCDRCAERMAWRDI